MNRDQKRSPHDDEESGEGESHAADEPTAVWDERALRAAGLTDLLHKRRSDPPPAPATPAVPTGGDPSIVIDQSMTAAPMAAPPEPPAPAEHPPAHTSVHSSAPVFSAARARSPGWGTTLALAVTLGALVYLAIRLLRG